MKTEKEIIDEIVSQIKLQPERKYRPGAWEHFKERHPATRVKTRQIPRWASAAALLLLGMGSLYYVNRTTDTSEGINNLLVSEENTTINNVENQSIEQNTVTPIIENNSKEISTTLVNIIASTETNSTLVQNKELYRLNNLPVIATTSSIINPNLTVSLGDISELNETAKRYAVLRNTSKISFGPTAEQLTLASSSTPTLGVRVREVENIKQNKRFNYGERFDMSIFVSPQATGDKMNIGGGLTIAYNLSKKFSIRTGASYNSYEVGVVKTDNTPMGLNSFILDRGSDNEQESDPGLKFPTGVMFPNVNAITSIVQSIDIPLELKYNVGKTVYAVSGISYSAIIGQKGTLTQSNEPGIVPYGPKKSEKVSKNVVASDGYNGFVNFAIGKKMNVNNKFSLSIEPYLKIPVGEYRRADMDYTNGGIRLMTNF